MPRPIRFIQKWIISRRARKPAAVEEARKKIQRPVYGAQQTVREKYLNKLLPNKMANNMFGRIRNTNHRFALVRAFRAAGIFGNETRNDLLNVKTWGEVEQKIGTKRARVMQQTYRQSLGAAREAEKSIFVEGEAHSQKRKAEPAQQAVHGNLVQGKFGNAARKKAA